MFYDGNNDQTASADMFCNDSDNQPTTADEFLSWYNERRYIHT